MSDLESAYQHPVEALTEDGWPDLARTYEHAVEAIADAIIAGNVPHVKYEVGNELV